MLSNLTLKYKLNFLLKDFVIDTKIKVILVKRKDIYIYNIECLNNTVK